jgi:hypothetical protein
MAYTFNVQQSFSTAAYELNLSSFTYLRVKRLSDGVIVWQTLLSGSPAIRVAGGNYEIGIFSTSDPTFLRTIDCKANPHTMDVTKIGADYCFLGTTNDGGGIATYQYKINLCVLQITKSGSTINLVSPVCPGQSGCGNCFSES